MMLARVLRHPSATAAPSRRAWCARACRAALARGRPATVYTAADNEGTGNEACLKPPSLTHTHPVPPLFPLISHDRSSHDPLLDSPPSTASQGQRSCSPRRSGPPSASLDCWCVRTLPRTPTPERPLLIHLKKQNAKQVGTLSSVDGERNVCPFTFLP